MAGYSATPLLKKLGIRPEHKLLLIDEPQNYCDMVALDLSNQLARKNEIPDLVHLFVKNKSAFDRGMKKIKPLIFENPDITIWISWYKKSAGIPTDITENVIRSVALKNGLVDVKVCAVSETWSGLKLVVPLKLR
jgi:hypothetical protein